MKKITLVCFLFFTALAVNAQDFTRVDGTYRLRVRETGLYVTIPSSAPIADGERLVLTFEEFSDQTNRQLFFIRANENGRFADDEEGNPQPLDFFIESLLSGQGAVVYNEPTNVNTDIGIQNLAGEEAIAAGMTEAGSWFFRNDNLWFNDVRIGTASAARRVVSSSGNVRVTGGNPQQMFDFIEDTFDPTLSTDSNELSNNFFVSNPVNNTLSISTSITKIKEVKVFSLLGKSVLSKSYNALSKVDLNISNLSAGVYVVKIDSDKGSFTTKVLKN